MLVTLLLIGCHNTGKVDRMRMWALLRQTYAEKCGWKLIDVTVRMMNNKSQLWFIGFTVFVNLSLAAFPLCSFMHIKFALWKIDVSIKDKCKWEHRKQIKRMDVDVQERHDSNPLERKQQKWRQLKATKSVDWWGDSSVSGIDKRQNKHRCRIRWETATTLSAGVKRFISTFPSSAVVQWYLMKNVPHALNLDEECIKTHANPHFLWTHFWKFRLHYNENLGINYASLLFGPDCDRF